MNYPNYFGPYEEELNRRLDAEAPQEGGTLIGFPPLKKRPEKWEQTDYGIRELRDVKFLDDVAVRYDGMLYSVKDSELITECAPRVHRNYYVIQQAVCGEPEPAVFAYARLYRTQEGRFFLVAVGAYGAMFDDDVGHQIPLGEHPLFIPLSSFSAGEWAGKYANYYLHDDGSPLVDRKPKRIDDYCYWTSEGMVYDALMKLTDGSYVVASSSPRYSLFPAVGDFGGFGGFEGGNDFFSGYIGRAYVHAFSKGEFWNWAQKNVPSDKRDFVLKMADKII